MQAARDHFAISGLAFYRALRENPDLKQAYHDVQAGRADMMYDEAYAISTDANLDPRHARVASDIRMKMAAAFDRQRFGERIDMTLSGHVDLTAALLEARNRASLQPPRDLEVIPDAEYMAIPKACPDGAADTASVDPGPPIPGDRESD